MASILRTYYTWQLTASGDIAWELIPMGLWTWTEISVGIIVGCLPALPKFFHHIGPKIYRSSSGRGLGRESSIANSAPKGNVLIREKGSFAKYGAGPSVSDPWNYPHASPAQLHEGYLVLDEFDAWPPRETTSNIETEWPGQGIATTRDDLEHGQAA